MTVKEFWEKIDAIDVDDREDGRYTDQEMYDIGCAFIELNNSEKREIGGWDKLVEVLQPLDRNGEVMKKGDTFRQWIKGHRYAKDEMIHNEAMLSGKTIDTISFAEFEEKTENLKRNLYKQQVKTRDTMNSYRRTIRDEARIDNMKDLMVEAIKDLKDLPEVEYDSSDRKMSATEAVLLFSDMHIGVQIDNFYNKYNTEIARLRVNKLVRDTIALCQRNNVCRLNVLNLGDAIHGAIHLTARLEQEEDVITQVMLAAEIIADALVKLKEAAPEIVYRSCTDNHARVVADLKQHIEKENFGKLIDFYLEARLKDSGIIFAKDNLDDDIGMFNLMNGKNMIFVHGHRENYNAVIQSFLGATRQFTDYICLGHYHSSKMKEFQGVKVFVNGSVVGSEQYAQSHRLYGTPEQTLLIFEENNEAVNYINLDIR